MCWGCVVEDFGISYEDGQRIAQQENVRAVTAMIEQLYRMPDCQTGGPLHVVVEDTNVGDEFLEMSTAEGYTPEVVAHAQAVLDALRPLTVQERAVATVSADTREEGSQA